MKFPLYLYLLNSILPHLSLICQNKFFDRGLHIFSFFLLFYPLKLVTGFVNVTSFKLKIITLISTSTIPLNLFMEIILSLTYHIYYHSHYLFIYFILSLNYSSRPHYFDPMFLQGFTYLKMNGVEKGTVLSSIYGGCREANTPFRPSPYSQGVL